MPVEGRIVNTEGQPVAGALVEVTAISEGNNGSLDEWFASAKKPDAYYWSLNRYRSTFIGGGSRVRAKREDTALATKTDESGRFVLRGLGRERMATVFVSGEPASKRPPFMSARARARPSRCRGAPTLQATGERPFTRTSSRTSSAPRKRLKAA